LHGDFEMSGRGTAHEEPQPLTAQPASTLLTTYFEQREAMRRFVQARLGSAADIEDVLQVFT
jgi:DNA-directed RNA polymerase specialized sigma24 family protein